MSTLQQGAQHLGFIGIQSLGERHEGKKLLYLAMTLAI